MNNVIIKADGTKEPFEKDKLAHSLKNAGGSDEIIANILEHIGREMGQDGELTTGHIYRHAFKLLHQHSMPLAIKYSLRRALAEFGPEGFPFEKFIAKIFQAWGYETMTDQLVSGHCVSHEVDVVAWNQKKLLMVEAKFHNEFGLKSDLKVALYIKARFDDLRMSKFDYGGRPRALDEGWFVTNTKFTDQAIKYGECQGLKMLGWNYPAHGNLQDIIEQLRLHPFTCLASLSNVHKKQLLQKGVVLCSDLVEKPELLKEIGMSDEEASKTLEEVKKVCPL